MSISSSGADVRSHHPRRTGGPGRTRRHWLLPTVLLSVLLLAVGSFTGWRLVSARLAGGCPGPADKVVIATGPAQQDVLASLADRWTATRPAYRGSCIGATVVAKQPGEVASALGPAWDVVRDGTRPDVWLPDSSLWLAVAAGRTDAAALIPPDRPSIGTSPVVLAVRQPVAASLGWPGRTLGWQDVLATIPKGLTVGMTDPTVSTVGLAAVLAVLDRDGTGTVSDQQLLASIGFTQALTAIAPDPGTYFSEQNSRDAAVGAFPALERDVAAHDANRPATPLVPVYLPKDPIVADFPYTVLTADWVSPAHRAAADRFRRYLTGPAGTAALGQHGLRGPDQAVVTAAALPADQGFQPTVAPPRRTPDTAALRRIIGEWQALQRPSNVLVVLDTSGSMNQPVTGTGQTRLQLLQRTAAAGFNLLTNQTSIGLWDFSVRAPDPQQHRELVGYGPLAQPVGDKPRQQALAAAAAQLTAGGFTPLYDTVYAAFREMQNRWQPNSTNAVLLITDGANEYPGGLDLGGLLDRLKNEGRPDQPVPVIAIAVGPEADAAALQQISQATGGRTFVEKDPAKAAETLVLAFSGRLR
jgi:Ca-activated chloride channel family protein